MYSVENEEFKEIKLFPIFVALLENTDFAELCEVGKLHWMKKGIPSNNRISSSKDCYKKSQLNMFDEEGLWANMKSEWYETRNEIKIEYKISKK